MPGGSLDALKRRLLAGAVDDNVRAIRNQPRHRLHRRAPFPWRLAAAGALAVAVAWLAALALR
ncbi:MAG: hypothetical protein F9K18_15200, partial [Thermoanaerobaculia bacterium]